MIRKLLLAILLLAGSLAAQNQFYVSTSGSDSSAGTSPGAAWRTIAHAIASYTVNSIGAVINVAPGTYNGAINLNRGGPSSTVRVVWKCTQQWGVPSAAGCLIRNAGGGDQIITANANNIDIGALPQFGFDISNPQLSYGINVICNLQNPPPNTGQCSNGNSLHIFGNYLHELSSSITSCEVNPNGHPAIIVQNRHGPFVSDLQIIGNRLTDIGSQSLSALNGGPGCKNYYAMYIDAQGAVVQNNIAANIAGYALHFYSSPCRGSISNNDFSRTELTNIIVGGGDCNNGTPSGSVSVTNNILGQTAPGQPNLTIGVPGGSGIGSPTHPILVSSNIYSGGAGGQFLCIAPCNATNANAKTEAPTTTYVGYTGGNNDDFHLKAGSQAIGGGATPTTCALNGLTPCTPPMDFSNLPRPLSGPQDIGAYKFVTGGAPLANLSPNPLAFGSVPVSTPKVLTATLQNTGGANLTFTAPTIAGTNAADYKITTNSCVSPLPAGSSCPIVVTFTPSAAGARNASLTLTDNAAGSPHQLPLTGTGGAVALTVTPASLSFAAVTPGQCSAAPFPLFTVTSTGSSPLIISSETLIGTNPGDFQFAGTGSCNVGTSYAPGQSCTVSQKFCPTTAGAKSASVSIASNAPTSPTLAPETGAGATSSATLTPTTFNFGNVPIGTSSAPRAFVFTNTGTSTLTITSITVGP